MVTTVTFMVAGGRRIRRRCRTPEACPATRWHRLVTKTNSVRTHRHRHTQTHTAQTHRHTDTHTLAHACGCAGTERRVVLRASRFTLRRGRVFVPRREYTCTCFVLRVLRREYVCTATRVCVSRCWYCDAKIFVPRREYVSAATRVCLYLFRAAGTETR
eukprot:222787-Rhodomonas_salina.1